MSGLCDFEGSDTFNSPGFAIYARMRFSITVFVYGWNICSPFERRLSI